MIAAADLLPGQTYYLAGTYRFEAWQYVGLVPGGTLRQPVYVFANERRYPTRFYEIELLSFHATPGEASQMVVANLEKALSAAQAQLEPPNESTGT